jgi:hypothetical protein
MVVTYGRRCVERFVYFAGFKDALGTQTVRPHTREAVCHKLFRDRVFVDAEKCLYMVAHFVRDNIGLRHIARRAAKFVAKLGEERLVEVDGLVFWAIVRA